MAGELFIYYGEETFLIEQAVREHKNKFDPAWEAFGFQLLEGVQANSEKVINAVQAIPSFTPARLIIIKDPLFLRSKAKPTEEETELSEFSADKQEAQPEAEDQLIACFENIPDGVKVILQVTGNIDLRRRLAKSLKKQARTIQEFKPFSRWDRLEILQWIIRAAKERGYSLSRETAENMIEISGSSLQLLNNELDKIITYIGPQLKTVTVEAIKAVASQGELSFFDFGEALRRKELGQALEILSRMNKDGEKPQMVLGFMVSQTRFLLQLKELQQKRTPYADIAGLVKKHPFYVKNILEKDLGRFSLAELQNLYYALQEADYKSKTGMMPPFLAMEMALISLSK